MDHLGNLGATYGDGNANEAGWTRGLGYCDAQCPTDLHFVQVLFGSVQAACSPAFMCLPRVV